MFLSALSLAFCAWSGGLSTPPRRHPGQVAILNTNPIVLCVFRIGLWGALLPNLRCCDSPQLSPLRLAVCLVVSGALLDVDMNALVDRSPRLVEPVLVVSHARAGRTEHVQRRVQSLLATIPIAKPCGRSCAPEILVLRASLLLLSLSPSRIRNSLARGSHHALTKLSSRATWALSTLWIRCESGVLELLGWAR